MKLTNDGALVLHQSDISHFMTCPEQFRVANGITPGGDFEKNLDARVETDAATVGTVTHAVIEYELAHGKFPSLEDALRWGNNFMGQLIMQYMQDGYEYRTQSFGEDPAGAIAKLSKLIGLWYNSQERDYWLELTNDHPGCITSEWSFDVPFITGRKGRYENIRLAGTADILDTYNNRVVDWKTSSQTYQRWEKQRWAVQPTVYTYAAASLGLIESHKEGYRFDYRVFNHKKNDPEPQEVTVYRSSGQHGWLVQMVSNMVAMIESDLEAWPLRDDHALCGEKWCPIWSQCKGMYVTHPEWS